MRSLLLSILVAGVAGVVPAYAVDFGVMETANPIAKRHFKFIGHPMVVREGPHRERDTGVSVGLGYGLSERVDAEVQVANFDDITVYGGDIEYSFLNTADLDMSLSAGGHYADTDFGSSQGFDLTYIASYDALRNAGIILYAALDGAYEEPDLDRQPGGLRASAYNTLHAVPGLEFRINRNVDVIGEIGLGLDDDATDYASVGVSYYFR